MMEVQAVVTPQGNLKINRKWCKGCKLCVDVCINGVLSLDIMEKIQVTNSEECTGCGMCETTCPDFAIRVMKHE